MSFGKIKKFFLDLISFNNPKAIVINLCLILILLILIPTSFLENLPLTPIKFILTNLVFRGNCPSSGFLQGCNVYSSGQTRAVSSILHLDFGGALDYNPLVLVLFPLIIILIIINIFKIIKNKRLS